MTLHITLLTLVLFISPALTMLAQDTPADAAIRALAATRGRVGEPIKLKQPVSVVPGVPGGAAVTQNSATISLHLSSLTLRAGARLVLLNSTGTEVWSTSEPLSSNDVWLPRVRGQSAQLRCDAPSSDLCAAIIDSIARGFSPKTLLDANEASTVMRQICGAGCELQDTVCPTLPPALSTAKRAVARLIIAGTESCSGFLVGDLGHLITNVHCIADAAAAQHVVFEFGSEEFSCPLTVDCNRVLKAPAERIERGALFVDKDAVLDVAIVKLPKVYADVYGFLKLRKAGPSLQENLGVVQHPRGESRKFTIDHVRPTGGVPCLPGLTPTVPYMADTLGGSSGSPVISLNSSPANVAIAVHQCVGCPNRGVSSKLIFERFAGVLPDSAFDP